MKHFERFKTITLIFFVFLSFIQVGILWNYQNHWLPISFISGFFSKATGVESIRVKEFLKPSRIVISRGFDEPHILLGQKDIKFNQVWEECKRYLRDTFITRQLISKVDYTDDDWGNIAVKQSIVLSFPAKIDIGLLKYMLGIDNSQNEELAGFYKMAISFDDNINSEMNIYITDGTTLCKYRLEPHTEPANPQDKAYFALESVFTDAFLNTPEKMGEKLPEYKLLKELFPRKDKAPFNFRPDIPAYIGDLNVDLAVVDAALPDWLYSLDKGWESLNNVARMILGADKDSYDADVDSDGNMILANVNNIYRISKTGVLDYKFLVEPNSKIKPDVKQAFEKAVNFISSKVELMAIKDENKNVVGIYLDSMRYDEKKLTYEFSFNYTIDGLPVVFKSIKSQDVTNESQEKVAESLVTKENTDQVDASGTIVTPKKVENNSVNKTDSNKIGDMPSAGIKVEVNNERVINCGIIFRKFVLISTKSMFNEGFKDFSANLFKKFDKGNLKKIAIEESFVGYYILENKFLANEPVWLIRTFDGNFIPVNLGQKR